MNGKHAYSAFVETQDTILENLRTTRNTLLTDSDWTQLEDSPLSEEKKTEWKNYRQKLRDLTNLDDLTSIFWPTQPS
ncbi:hypothetical protein ASE21_19260 [Flavobacterium sp. Root901]|nr:hypothetical protein ASE21_19260 [Flavobacterium sp. Root901]